MIPSIDQVDQNAETLAGQFRLGKFNGQVIDWPYILLGHCSTSHAAASYQKRRLSRPPTMLSPAGSRRLHP